MAIIDATGLFLGDRLAWCSDTAQLHWPRLYAAANNYARLELNYQKIISKAYTSFSKPPTETEFWSMIREYKNNFLLLVYQNTDGSLWGQWQTNDRYLLGHKNAEDKRSPEPSGESQDEYRKAYIEFKKSKCIQKEELADLLQVTTFRKDLFEKTEVTLVGVGGGEGVGEGRNLGLTPLSPSAPAMAKIRPEEFANTWNRLRGPLPKVETFTDSRRKKVIARIHEKITLERFAEAVENCRIKPHLKGDNGWTADFDWLVKNSTNIEKAINNPYGMNGEVKNGKTERSVQNATGLVAEIEDSISLDGGALFSGSGSY
jgi:hypothetical protein